MPKNLVSTGDTLDIIAPTLVKSGELLKNGGIYGVVQKKAKAGERVTLHLRGAFLLSLKSGDNPILGQAAYYDVATKQVTIDDSKELLGSFASFGSDGMVAVNLQPEAQIAKVEAAGGTPPVTPSLGVWTYKTSTGVPLSGEVRFNNADPMAASEVSIHNERQDSTDLSNLLGIIKESALIFLKVVNDQYVAITVSQVTDNGTYFTFGIADIQEGPAGLAGESDVNVAFDQVETGQALPVGLNGFGLWEYKQSVAVPSDGEVRFNNVDPSAATELRVAKERKDGGDLTVLLGLVTVGSLVYFQNAEDATQSVAVKVDAVTDNGTYFTYDFTEVVVGAAPLEDGKECALIASSTFPSGADIISLINAELGNVWWQQGLSNVIYVRDFSASSPELAPFLATSGPNTGKWVMPQPSTIVADTDHQSPQSILGRTIYAEGQLSVIGSVPNLKGIAMTAGIGSHTIGIETNNVGDLYLESLSILSDDVTREFFAMDAVDTTLINNCFLGIARPGVIDGRDIQFNDCSFLISVEPFRFGAGNEIVVFNGVRVPPGFVGVSGDLFDFASIPSAFGQRFILGDIYGGLSGASSGKAIVLIDDDDAAKQLIQLTGLLYPNASVGSTYIRALNDVDFNNNPEKSNTVDLDVANFIVTQRCGGLRYRGTSLTTITVQNQWEDLNAPFGQTALACGFIEVAPGELEYQLPTPRNLYIDVKSTHSVPAGTDAYEIGTFFQPNGGAYEVDPIDDGSGFPMSDVFDFGFSGSPIQKAGYSALVRFEQGDRIKQRVRNTAGTNDVNTLAFSLAAIEA